ncbi:MAG: ABC transporter substrate-binding protein [Anaerolineales bacterium]
MANRIASIMFLLALLIVGCSTLPAAVSTSSPGAPTALPVVESGEAAIAPASTAAASPIEVTDARGREVTLPAAPERIVVAGKASQLILHAAYLFPEARTRIIGMEQRLQRGLSMLPYVDPTYGSKSQLERDVAAEGIAPLHPDLVLLKSYLADSLGRPLEEIGIMPVYLDLETPAQFERDLRTLGMIFDDSARAEAVIAYYQERLENLAAEVSSLPEDALPKVLLLQYSERGGEVAFTIPSVDWLQTQIVRLAGGTPVWSEAAEAGGWTIVNFEQIAAWNPDQIFIVNYAGDAGVTAAALAENPEWASLQAVQQGQLYGFPGDFLSWDQPDTHWILGLEWLAITMHPGFARSIDLMQEVESFYHDLYGIEPSVIEAEIVPLINGDFSR